MYWYRLLVPFSFLKARNWTFCSFPLGYVCFWSNLTRCLPFLSIVQEEIEVEGKLLRAGKSVAVVSVDFRKKKTGKLIAQGRHTKYLAVSSRLWGSPSVVRYQHDTVPDSSLQCHYSRQESYDACALNINRKKERNNGCIYLMARINGCSFMHIVYCCSHYGHDQITYFEEKNSTNLL